MRNTLLLIITLFALTNCGEDKTEKTDKSVKFITYNDPNYSISFPSDWINVTDKNPNVDFAIVAQPDTKTDVFTENVNVIEQEIGDSIDMDRFLELTQAQLTTYLPDHIMAEKKIVKQNGMDCLVLEYQATQNNFKLRYLQHAYIYSGKAYIITFTAEQVIFTDYRKTAERIMKSFHFNK